MWFNVIFLIAIVTTAFAGSPGQFALRLANGLGVRNARQYPYVLALFRSEKNCCSGVLIEDDVALTSADCVKDMKEEELTIRAGSLLREELEGENTQTRKVNKIMIHPKFKAQGAHDYDIAIVFTDKPFVLGPFVNVIELARETKPNSRVTLLGWGRSSTFYIIDRLQSGVATIIPNEKCNKDFGGELYVTDSMGCALSSSGQVLCGDSGSPIVVRDVFNRKSDQLIGIATHSEVLKFFKQSSQDKDPVLIGMTCDVSKPSVFTFIPESLNWIEKYSHNPK